ncbi:hypothetical protein ACIBEJ_05235 [Nonomuraea sp. NPDC050790]|uniref:hypothetical protein n=1 Tax=Nonomuraea sp. NPDC050790 TaxID=3364371 RepID=UPI00378769D5
MTTVHHPDTAVADADAAVGDLVDAAFDVSTRCASQLRRLTAQLGEADLADGERRQLAVTAADLQDALATFLATITGPVTSTGVNDGVLRLAAADDVEHLHAGELAASRLGDDALSDVVLLAALGRAGNREFGAAVHAAAGAGASLAAMAEAADMAPVEVRQRWTKWARRRVRDGVLNEGERTRLAVQLEAELEAMA